MKQSNYRGWVGVPVLGHVLKQVSGRHVPKHVLEHVPGYVLKHVFRYMPDKHLIEYVPGCVLKRIAQAVLMT